MATLIIIGVIALLLVGAVVFFYVKGQQAGETAEHDAVVTAEVKAARAGNEAQINAPRTAPDIHERLRKGGGL